MFAKACEIFILELTLRAWMHTDECKRRTLQRNDVAVAISRSDTFDFLIDIVPREEAKLKKSEVLSEMDAPSYAVVWKPHGGRQRQLFLQQHRDEHRRSLPGSDCQ